ncbi:MAG TPA: M23 family metallopeptidase [Bacteroidetes bacterium]|nr:M23 family metallopeptidase [Bacteroidota bacterium]
MSRRRHKRISIMFVPDGSVEPYTIRMSIRTMRIIGVIAGILLLHIIIGGFAYYRWYETNERNAELVHANAQLLDDNKRVYKLSQDFEDLSLKYEKVLKALGVERVGGTTGSLKTAQYREPGALSLPSRSAYRENVERRKSRAFYTSSSFIVNRKNSGKDFTSNLPTLLPVEGYLTNQFAPEDWIHGKRHFGVDIAAKRGTTIRAAGDGIVIFAGWTATLGNLVILNHGDDIFSYYGHNSRLLVDERMYVRKGDPIAELGNSGQSSGPHLHFEIWKDGKPVDPRDFILALNPE